MDGEQDDSERKNWMKRHNWAKCREPFKTELDTIASQWIEGSLSNEQLALEMWQLWSKMRLVESPAGETAVDLSDVRSQLGILAESLCTAALHPQLTPEERRNVLEHIRQIDGDGTDIHR